MHRYLLHNGDIRDTSEKFMSPGQVGLLNGWGVFSTLRVRDGVLFAWERHFARMKKDAELMRIPFPSDSEAMRAELLKLVEANAAHNATLRVCVVRNRGGMFEAPNITRDYDLIAFTRGLKEWGAGVRLGVKRQARHSSMEFAGAKILSWSMNLTWLEEAQARGFDEALLLDEHDAVSECTSANIFLVKGRAVWTPPLSSGCLPGITRALILEELHVAGISIGERGIRLEELAAADDVFITSSTRDLLPVLEVEGQRMGANPEVRQLLAQAFAQYQDQYVSQELAKSVPEPQQA